MKIDYQFKAKVLSNRQDLLKEQRKISMSIYAKEALEQYGVIYKTAYDYETAIKLQSFYLENNPAEWKECERINKAFYYRTKRLKDKIGEMCSKSDCLFLTLTFNDDTLNKTSDSTRRKYITRFLGQFGVPYVANKDFGKKNHREHYHAVIQVPKIDYQLYYELEIGTINGQVIKNSVNDKTRVAKYVSKLTNHAIKETTKRSCIIYGKVS